MSPDGKLLAAVGGDQAGEQGRLVLWETAGGMQVAAARLDPPIALSVVFAPDGGTLFTADEEGQLQRWSAHGLRPLGSPLPVPQPGVSAFALSPDGKSIAVASEWRIALWDAAAGPKLADVGAHPPA